MVGFAFQGASRDGQPEQWRAENRGNGVRIYMGNPSAFVQQGEHTYELVFRTDRQLGYFGDHDELYWNVTGNGWDFPIDRVSARVELPPEIPAAEIRLEAYTGPQGAKGQEYTAQMAAGGPRFATTRGLGPREGLTIVACGPGASSCRRSNRHCRRPPRRRLTTCRTMAATAGRPPSTCSSASCPTSGLPALLGVLGLALLMTYYYYVWARVGRDPPGRIIIPEYQSPNGVSPAAMRYLLEMSYDDNAFAAAVLSLAVKGYLRIEQSAGILGTREDLHAGEYAHRRAGGRFRRMSALFWPTSSRATTRWS